jgi:hypothetical protein
MVRNQPPLDLRIHTAIDATYEDGGDSAPDLPPRARSGSRSHVSELEEGSFLTCTVLVNEIEGMITDIARHAGRLYAAPD